MEEVQSNGTKQIYGLMAEVLAEIQAVEKNRANAQQGYKFRGIDDVYSAVHPLFAKHKIFTLPRVLNENTTERTTASGTILRFVNLTMAYDFFAPDGSHVTAEVVGEAMDAGDKASNKAMSAAQKYALIQTLCIPTGSTPDADEVTQPEVTTETRQVSKSSTAPDQCPKCKGAMWDNRESKRNPKAPDYKCKNKQCDGAIWLNSHNDTERKMMLQSIVDACRLLNERNDEITWSAKTLDAFAVDQFDTRTDDLDNAQLNQLLKMLSDRLDSLKASEKADKERQAMVDRIEKDVPHKELRAELKKNFQNRTIYELTVEELDKLQQAVIAY